MFSDTVGELNSQTPSKRLPSRQALRCFEAAARRENFSKAAEELHLTHGAISRAVRLLEDDLGVTLFDRRSRRVFLTEAGRHLAQAVHEGLERMRQATQELRTAASPGSFQDRSDRCTRPSIPAARPTNTPKSVIDLIGPLTRSPRLVFCANSCQGLALHCFMPSEMRRLSSSISSTMTSTSSPRVTSLVGAMFLLVQSISETCTRPSMPGSSSTNAP